MKLDGRRESVNVEDRRGKRTAATAGGLGLGGIVIALIVMFLGGDPNAVMEQMGATNQTEYVAGVWAYNDNEMFGSIEDGDIEEALNAASKIGDDYLQKQAYGRTMPETFNHGTSAQRSRWLKKGLTTGDVSLGDTFSPPYSSL